MGSRKYTTSHLELPFITDVYMLHAGSEIFHDAKVGKGGGLHVDLMMTSPVEKKKL